MRAAPPGRPPPFFCTGDPQNGHSLVCAAIQPSDAASPAILACQISISLHDVGTFAQVHNIVRIPNDSTTGEEAATLLLLGHRRLRKLGTMKRDPTVVKVEHLKGKRDRLAEEMKSVQAKSGALKKSLVGYEKDVMALRNAKGAFRELRKKDGELQQNKADL